MMSEIRSVISTDNSEDLDLIKQRNSAFAAVLKTNFVQKEWKRTALPFKPPTFSSLLKIYMLIFGLRLLNFFPPKGVFTKKKVFSGL